MIKSWTLEHFKSVFCQESLEMGPLTIFAGANSSGKSTLIQSILLTTQTLQGPVPERCVILNGHIVKLGSFNDIISNNQESSSITIGFELSTANLETEEYHYYRGLQGRPWRPGRRSKISSIYCKFSFSPEREASIKEIQQLQTRLDDFQLRLNYSILSNEGSRENQTQEIRIQRKEVNIKNKIKQLSLKPKQLSGKDLKALEYTVSEPENTISNSRGYYYYPTQHKIQGANFNHFLPVDFAYVHDRIEDQVKQLLFSLRATIDDMPNSFLQEEAISIEPAEEIREPFIQLVKDISNRVIKDQRVRKENKENLQKAIREFENRFSLHTLKGVIDNLTFEKRANLTQELMFKWEDYKNAIIQKEKSEKLINYSLLPEPAGVGTNSIERFFTKKVKYLGPLRDEPKPVYPLPEATDTKDIGFKGEHTATVLEAHKHTPIEYISPTDIFVIPKEKRVKKTTLFKAVLDWLDYLGIAVNVKTFDAGKLGHGIKVSTYTQDALHDLTNVGVGVSQVLPILVLSLLAEPNSTLIFEQPELHLHPRVQTRLADFFLSMISLKKQCIVETHSVNLINRLRYLSAISDNDEVSKDVVIYFVEKEKGNSNFRKIKINKYGVIEDWPKGFFDESEELSTEILKASIAKKRKEKGVE